MTDKELRHLSREELIEILLYMRQEIDRLREENGKLTQRVDAFVSEALSEKRAEKNEGK